MILAADAHYAGEGAVAAGVLFARFSDETPVSELLVRLPRMEPYAPGFFYRRELPCVLALLERLPSLPELIVVDGYVRLGAAGRPGLGYHLWRALDERVPVIGVAKTAFTNTPEECKVFRGRSARPLYVTAAGLALDVAKESIRAMHGEHRVPTLLRRVDRLSRGGSSDPATHH